MARIIIVDDFEQNRNNLMTALQMWGHKVVGVASTREAAIVEAKLAKEKGAEVAIVDGNLKSGASGAEDGRAVSAKLQEYAPDVYIIAYTLQEDDKYGHCSVSKSSPSSMKEMKAAIEKALAMSPKVT